LHYKNLKLYLDLELKLKKIHRILMFKEDPWMRNYIQSNTERRKVAKNPFEEDFFKLMNNSVFGKTMENLRKRVNIELVNNHNRLEKLSSKPSFVGLKIFDNDLVAVHKLKSRLVLDRPKTLMYDFHYNYIRPKYGNKAKLLFTDTDSLCYHIKTDDIYEDLFEDKDLFDNSDYPSTSKYYFADNKKVIGKMKDETSGNPIREFIGLRSKMYSYVTEDIHENKEAKEISKTVVKKEICFSDYKKVLFESTELHHHVKAIRSVHHRVGTYDINKKSLSCYDDKRYILDDGINSYAYGHYII